MPLPKESFSEAKRKLEALDKKDAERRRTAELKNNLEAYIYSTKDKVTSLVFVYAENEFVFHSVDSMVIHITFHLLL